MNLALTTALLAFVLTDSPDPKLYPDAPFAKIAGKNLWARPRACIEGTVTYVKREDDGDWHCTLEDGGRKVVCEIIPELPMDPPKVGQRIKVWGIPRWDGQHRWGEIHPVIGWSPK